MKKNGEGKEETTGNNFFLFRKKKKNKVLIPTVEHHWHSFPKHEEHHPKSHSN
jgi:hypothetical protein